MDLGTPVSTLDLAVISGRIPRKRKWVYTNDPWLFDSTSVQLKSIYSHFPSCTQVPWSPSSLSVGLLTSVNGKHQWSLIRWCLIMLDIGSFIRISCRIWKKFKLSPMPRDEINRTWSIGNRAQTQRCNHFIFSLWRKIHLYPKQ